MLAINKITFFRAIMLPFCHDNLFSTSSQALLISSDVFLWQRFMAGFWGMTQGFLWFWVSYLRRQESVLRALGWYTNGSAAYLPPLTLVNRLKQQKDPLIIKQQKNRTSGQRKLFVAYLKSLARKTNRTLDCATAFQFYLCMPEVVKTLSLNNGSRLLKGRVKSVVTTTDICRPV